MNLSLARDFRRFYEEQLEFARKENNDDKDKKIINNWISFLPWQQIKINCTRATFSELLSGSVTNRSIWNFAPEKYVVIQSEIYLRFHCKMLLFFPSLALSENDGFTVIILRPKCYCFHFRFIVNIRSARSADVGSISGGHFSCDMLLRRSRVSDCTHAYAAMWFKMTLSDATVHKAKKKNRNRMSEFAIFTLFGWLYERRFLCHSHRQVITKSCWYLRFRRSFNSIPLRHHVVVIHLFMFSRVCGFFEFVTRLLFFCLFYHFRVSQAENVLRKIHDSIDAMRFFTTFHFRFDAMKIEN